MSATDRRAAIELACALVAVLGGLALFSDKAFTIDDPLFVWLARHLQTNPFDFFGFDVNWYGVSTPMYELTKNPPGAGYYAAAVGALVGFGERGLHLAYLLPAAAVVVFTWLLARRLCERPLAATLVGLVTPVFLVSSTNVMSDTPMLALWCGSIWCWIRAFDARRPLWALAAVGLAALAALTKYFGAALLPLLLVYGLARERRPGAWLLWLLVPVAVIAGYELLTHSLYGVSLFSDAVVYAAGFEEPSRPGIATLSLEGLVYAGGCLLPALFFAPLLWPRAALGAAAFAALAIGTLSDGRMRALVGQDYAHFLSPEWLLVAQLLALALGGASVVALAVAEPLRRRDPESWLLAAWILGTLGFATWFNWVNNGRSNLPMAPALGIAIARRLEARGRPLVASPRVLAAALPAAALAVCIAWADWRWAGEVRDTARHLADRYGEGEERLYFYGHWGFQYYMEQAGGVSVEAGRTVATAGDVLVVPDNNVFVEQPRGAILVEVETRPAPSWVRTVGRLTGAGFYASNMASLPFVFGSVLPDHYTVWRVPPGRTYRPFAPP